MPTLLTTDRTPRVGCQQTPRAGQNRRVRYERHLVYDMAVDGQYLYMAASYQGLEIADISNAAAPQLVCSGHYINDFAHDEACGVAVSGNYAYVTRSSAGLEVLDISDRANPVEVAQFTTYGGMDDIVIRATMPM